MGTRYLRERNKKLTRQQQEAAKKEQLFFKFLLVLAEEDCPRSLEGQPLALNHFLIYTKHKKVHSTH